MKTKLLFLSGLFILSVQLNAQQWEAVGPDDFEQLSYTRTDYNSIIFDSNNTPYVAFKEIDWGGKITVKKFNGTTWTTVGNTRFSAANLNYPSFTLDNSDTPFIIFNGEGSLRATVKKFDGTNWVTVGNVGFSDGEATYNSIAFNSSNTPYVVYQDANINNRAIVKSFDGTNWVTVGADPVSGGAALYTVISISNSDSIFVAYQDYLNNRRATVRKFDGSTWVDVGSAFSTGEALDISTAFSSSDTLYVAYHDKYEKKPVVKKFDGNIWVTVGASLYEVTTNQTTKPHLVFDNNDVLHITYRDEENNDKTTVKKFDGNDWVSVGPKGFSDDAIQHPHLSFSTDNTPFVVHDDTGRKAEVKKFIGNEWVTVGVEGFSESIPRHIDVAIDNNDITYVVYHPDGQQSGNKANVKKFNGNDWETVGMKDFSDGTVSFTAIAINSADVPYVAYMDGAFANKATVKKFVGNQWVTVGTEGFSDGNIGFTSIAIDNDDVPFIAFRDGANGNKATVKKFNGSQWITVGTEGLSDGETSYLTLDFDSSNNAYLSFMNFDSYNSYREVMVKKYNGTDWVDVSSNNFSDDETEYPVLSIDKQDIAYVTYKDKTDGKSRVKRFDGTDWVIVGSEVFSQSNFLTSIAFDGNNTPYVAFSDSDFEEKATVKKFNGSTWITVESEGVSAGNVQTRPHLGFDKNGNLIMIYDSPDLFAKKYATGVLATPNYAKTASELTVYPNPVKSQLNIAGNSSNIKDIEIYDYTGKLVKKIKWEGKNTRINSFTPGVYILKIKTDTGITTKKIIKM